MAARIQSQQAAAKAHQTLAATSANIASVLKLTILHESDLIVSAAAWIGANPAASNTQFKRWANSNRVGRRYPELLGIGHAEQVPASKLGAFARAALRDPAGSLSPGGKFKLIPPGHRPFYCLVRGSWSRPGYATISYPVGYDLCRDRPVAKAVFASRDSGIDAYVPATVGPKTLLGVQAAVYRGGLAPMTKAARRAAFAGGVGLVVLPTALLGEALVGHPGIGVTFAYRDSSSNVSFSAGRGSSNGETVVTSLHNGWRLRTEGARYDAGLLQQPASRTVLIGGIVLSLLIAALVGVLGTGRARAARLVNLRTGELRHQALHDALTGLANRVLIKDRLDRLTASSRRDDKESAVLFIDLDGFKEVNDTFGHAAGDQLLRTIGERLTTGLREVDTVGRLGGDEFVAIVGGESAPGAELTAQRLLELVAQPVAIEGSAAPVAVTASVGIARGMSTTGEELLRRADVAVYRAKASGGNCYELFAAGIIVAAA